MKIDLTKLRRFNWFEDENGNVYDGSGVNLPHDIECFTYHVVNPLVYTKTITEYGYHPEYLHGSNRLYKAMLNFKWFYNFMYKRMKKHGDRTFKDIATFNTDYRSMSDVIIAMVNSGDYTLEEAIYICANSCERCSNVLAYKYLDGKDGYPEYSKEWKKCNTVCDFCRGE